jgi:hypothetical protein
MISDAVVIGVVLGLVFAAACYYLYTRSSSLERKVGLMENILLDLKVTTEQALMSATEAPAGPAAHDHEQRTASSEPAKMHTNALPNTPSGNMDFDDHGVRTLSVDSPRSGRLNVPTQIAVEREAPAVSVNYEAMTYKELIAIAKQKGVSGTRNASKAHVIDLLRRHDAGGGTPMKQETLDGLDAQFTTTPLDENMDKAGTDLELLSANELGNSANDNGAPIDVDEVDGSLVQ